MATQLNPGEIVSVRTEGGCFLGGSIPWNKGIKIATNTGKTHFKKGFTPWNKGLTRKTDNRLAQAWLGKKRPEARNWLKSFVKGQEAWNKGVPAWWVLGDKNPRWKGGVTKENHKIRCSLEYKLWRTAVFERDNYTCVWCSVKSIKGVKVTLHADHIKPFSKYPSLRLAIDNGRTLCIDCHKKTDSYNAKSK